MKTMKVILYQNKQSCIHQHSKAYCEVFRMGGRSNKIGYRQWIWTWRWNAL